VLSPNGLIPTRRYGVKIVSCKSDVDALRRCITAGFFANAAKLSADGTYRTVREGQAVEIHPSSVLYGEDRPQWVVFYEVGFFVCFFVSLY
jgi:HrpA-like RNA helicase